MQKIKITLKIGDIVPYERNPRKNDKAVKEVKQSIIECGYNHMIEVDENNIVLSGHTRLKALQLLKYVNVETIRITGLTDEQKRKYRILANKTGEIAEWDLDLLALESMDLDFSNFDLDLNLGSLENEIQDVSTDSTNTNTSSNTETLKDDAKQENNNINNAPGDTNNNVPSNIDSNNVPTGQNKEIDLDNFSDENFDYECPRCNFRFN